MELVSRKVIYRLYPSASQETALIEMLRLHQWLYNAALEQRIAAWRLQRKSLSAYDQMRDLTDLRAGDERYAGLNAQSSQITLHRLHLAFQAFFRRCKNGEKPGFPRFRSLHRFDSYPATAVDTAACESPALVRFPYAARLERLARSRPAKSSIRLDAGTPRSR